MSVEVTAVLKRQRSSAQKVRLAADKVRGMRVESALNLLQHGLTKAERIVLKALDSAIANAENNNGLDIDELFITRIFVDAGSTLKRFRARARGRGARILKRTCHVTVVVKEQDGRNS